jgi:hypothetical protein
MLRNEPEYEPISLWVFWPEAQPGRTPRVPEPLEDNSHLTRQAQLEGYQVELYT